MKLLSLYRAADELNLTIPEQVAMAGYSDPMLSLILTPAPCGFDIPTRKLGEESCDLLFRCIAGKPAPHKVLVETHFQMRLHYAKTVGKRPGNVLSERVIHADPRIVEAIVLPSSWFSHS